MGAFLDKPKTEKSSAEGKANGISYAVSSMQGWRIDMEDAHVIQIPMCNDPLFHNWSFFAVFDGHAGSQAAQHSSENLLDRIIQTSSFVELKQKLNQSGGNLNEDLIPLLEKGIKAGFLELDAEMQKCSVNDKERSGTTVICSMIAPSHIVLANLGDSRAVLSRKGLPAFGTQDHKPFLPKERDRIMGAGGSVMIQRVNGSLAVSRALGDFDYKTVAGLHATQQLVSPEPDIYTIPRDSAVDEFLFLACDGVYDVMNNIEICEYLKSRLQVTNDLSSVANQVLDVCLSKGSRDNMTVILICLEAAPSINPFAIQQEEEWNREITERVHEILNASEGKDENDGLDADSIMQELEKITIGSCPKGVSFHAARTTVDLILAQKKTAE